MRNTVNLSFTKVSRITDMLPSSICRLTVPRLAHTGHTVPPSKISHHTFYFRTNWTVFATFVYVRRTEKRFHHAQFPSYATFLVA